MNKNITNNTLTESEFFHQSVKWWKYELLSTINTRKTWKRLPEMKPFNPWMSLNRSTVQLNDCWSWTQADHVQLNETPCHVWKCRTPLTVESDCFAWFSSRVTCCFFFSSVNLWVSFISGRWFDCTLDFTFIWWVWFFCFWPPVQLNKMCLDSWDQSGLSSETLGMWLRGFGVPEHVYGNAAVGAGWYWGAAVANIPARSELYIMVEHSILAKYRRIVYYSIEEYNNVV